MVFPQPAPGPSVPGPTCRWRGIRWSHLDCGSGLAGGGEQNHAGEEVGICEMAEFWDCWNEIV